VLVDADDGAVDQRILEIGIAGEDVEETLEDASLRPAAKAPEHAVLGAEQIG
jgi:hypothetical protein